MSKDEKQSFTFEAIGTSWQIDLLGCQFTDLLKKRILDRIADFDRAYSRFRNDSWVSTMALSEGEYTVPDDGKEMIDLYEKLYQITSSQVTLLIGNVLVEAGYDSKYSLNGKATTPTLKWEDTIDYKFPSLKLKKPAILDFGALGKGYLIDIVGQILLDENVHSFSIEAGGDILYKTTDNNFLTVGLENPQNFGQIIGKVLLLNKSICSSSGSRRRWGEYHHIMDPNSLRSPEQILSTWVIADSAIVADAIATSLFFVKAEELKRDFSFEYGILYHDFSFEKSQDFKVDLFEN